MNDRGAEPAAVQTASSSPWHPGERALHARLGVRDEMERLGQRVLRPFMPEQHQRFYENLPFMLTGVVDAADRPWATFVHGPPGFVHARSSMQLRIATSVPDADPAYAGFGVGRAIGLLGIELGTRRRNRVNGRIGAMYDHAFDVDVEQTMGNCPKYIQRRAPDVNGDNAAQAAEPLELSATDAHYQRTVRAADTFFVASYADTESGRAVDVSHRGGNPGFVRVEHDGSLLIPDYPGNRFFNTFGNILETGRVGLAFPRFDTGAVLQLTGNADVLFDAKDGDLHDRVTQTWRVQPEHIVYREAVLAQRWSLNEASPFNP
ncbi:MAG: pyridoxamine 5'-phosphate oxidase family protein [Pseudomonadota bacterium]